MKVINLTQHPATPEQREAGVIDLGRAEEAKVLLTFEELPSSEEVCERAAELADLAFQEAARISTDPASVEIERIMIGGAPFLMGPLAHALRKRGLRPVYAFSRRESREETLPDGSIRKVAVFRHLGFVE